MICSNNKKSNKEIKTYENKEFNNNINKVEFMNIRCVKCEMSIYNNIKFLKIANCYYSKFKFS